MTLKLIKLKEDDIFRVMEWRNSPEIAKFMYTDPKLTKETQLEWYRKISQDETFRYWIIEFENTKIGLICLYDINFLNKRCFLGILYCRYVF